MLAAIQLSQEDEDRKLRVFMFYLNKDHSLRKKVLVIITIKFIIEYQVHL